MFGDYCTSELWALRSTEQGVQSLNLGVSLPAGNLTSFGRDADGEMYALSLSGPVYRIVHLPGVYRFTSPAGFDVREHSTTVGQIAATDDSTSTAPEFEISGGDDATSVKIDADGRLAFRQHPDYERPTDANADNIYEVEVSAGTDPATRATQVITVNVSDDDGEVPSAPAAEVTTRTANAASFQWTEPDNTGPEITGYDVEFRHIGGSWRSLVHAGTARSATAGSLIADREYEFRIRARNDEGAGGWSNPPARTDASHINSPPRFTSASTVQIDENSKHIMLLSADDADVQDQIVSYDIESGLDSSRFVRRRNPPSLVFSGASDYERPRDSDGDNVYTVQISVTSGHLSRQRTTMQTVTVTVGDVAEPPRAPPKPEIVATKNSLQLAWEEPSSTGPAISGYDIEYKKSSETAWQTWSHTGTSRTATITDVDGLTEFEVQISAVNDEGQSLPSPAATAHTTPVAFAVVSLGVLNELVDLLFIDGDIVWVAERDGYVKSFDLSTGTVIETLLDISAETMLTYDTGLLGIEVDDDWLYIHFSNLDEHNRIDAIKRSGNGLDTSQRHTLLTESARTGRIHFGGQIVFGPDGHLYIGIGDRQYRLNGQDTSNLAGSILRITPAPGQTPPYTVPADNPLVPAQGEQSTDAPEIYIYGIKNPWRFSFDSENGDLWVVDVGSNLGREEVNYLPAAGGAGIGANLGWSVYEGTLPTQSGNAEPEDHIRPIHEYVSQQPTAFIGGRVYRGSAIDELVGHYIFADYSRKRIFGLSHSAGSDIEVADYSNSAVLLHGTPFVNEPRARPVSIVQDADGELYILNIRGGIFKLVPNGSP